jgi:hypothetical protein
MISGLLRDAGITASHSPAAGNTGNAALYVADTAQAARLLPRGACIVVSSDRAPGSIQRWLDAGAAGVLSEPLAAPALLAALQGDLTPAAAGRCRLRH